MTPPTGARALWITWESQPRNRAMARALDVPLHEIIARGGRLRRYANGIRATLALIRRERPAVVFASNPSLVLTLLLLACRRLLGYRFVSDAHYGGVVAVHGGALAQWALDLVHRRADLVIVTTEGHARVVRAKGGRAFVCPDPLPELPAAPARPAGLDGAQKSVFFICSFDKDEPFTEVFAAAELLAKDGFRVFTSGNYARVGLDPAALPHVTLLGYVDRATYDGFLAHADVALDLTTWEDCLVCGAYEAMVAHRPCVLSVTEALTALFTSGTVFTRHGPEEIARAVRDAYARRQELGGAIPAWIAAHRGATRRRAELLRATVGLPALAPALT